MITDHRSPITDHQSTDHRSPITDPDAVVAADSSSQRTCWRRADALFPLKRDVADNKPVRPEAPRTADSSIIVFED
jgi:hypothetical protein